MITVREMAAHHNLSVPRILQLIHEGRIDARKAYEGKRAPWLIESWTIKGKPNGKA